MQDDKPATQTTPIEPPTDERIMAMSLNAYQSHEQRAAMRGSLSDAAHLCDAIYREVLFENRYSGGRVTAVGQQLAAVAKRCGDAIWAMREKVKVRDGD